ncbi:MAG: hypothetical protein AAGE90_07040 [Pseudomonadota bacterium]
MSNETVSNTATGLTATVDFRTRMYHKDGKSEMDWVLNKSKEIVVGDKANIDNYIKEFKAGNYPDLKNLTEYNDYYKGGAQKEWVAQGSLTDKRQGDTIGSGKHGDLGGRGDILNFLPPSSYQKMVGGDGLTQSQADFLSVLSGMRTGLGMSEGDIKTAMKNYCNLPRDQQRYIADQFDDTSASVSAKYNQRGGNYAAGNDDLKDISSSWGSISDKARSAVALLKNADSDTIKALGMADPTGSDFLASVIDPTVTVDTDSLDRNDFGTWLSLSKKGNNFGELSGSDLTNFMGVFKKLALNAANVEQKKTGAMEMGLSQTTPDVPALAAGFMSNKHLNVSAADQTKIEVLYQMISGTGKLTAAEKEALFKGMVSGKMDAANEALLTKLKSDPSMIAADDTFVDNFKTESKTTAKVPDSAVSGIDNSAILFAALGGKNPADAASRTYLNQLSVDKTADYTPAGADSSSNSDSNVNSDDPLHEFKELVQISDAEIKSALDNTTGLSAEQKTALTTAIKGNSLSPSQISLLLDHVDDTNLSDDDKQTLKQAIENSIQNSRSEGTGDKKVVKVTADMASTALSNMDGLGVNDINTLQTAMANGTLSVKQANLLNSHLKDSNITPTDKQVVYSAIVHSQTNAEADPANVANWAAEKKFNKDQDNDGVIGNPWTDGVEVTPSGLKEQGYSDLDTMDLGSLMFEVMQGRCEALDKTVRTYGKQVQAKNDAIKTIQAAIDQLPAAPEKGKPPVDISGTTFDDPISGKTMKLTDYMSQNDIKLGKGVDPKKMSAADLDNLRSSLNSHSESLSSDSQLSMTRLQQAMDKYSTSVNMLTNFLSKWNSMLQSIARNLGQ